MKKGLRKTINRIINKAHALTGSDGFKLTLLNGATRLFKHPSNRIEHDTKNQLYWLRKGKRYLMSAPKPYFDFSQKQMYQRCEAIFCKHCTLGQGDVVIDIGAGIGTEVCYFVDQVGNTGKVFNLEASPSSFRILSLHTQKNGLTNVHNANLAISNSNEPIWMEEGDNYVVNAVNKDARGVQVEATTLDQFITDHQLDRIALLKVNIEGAEYDMMDGMDKTIDRIDNVAISCHDFLYGGGTKIQDKVVGYLEKHGFEIYYEDAGNKVLDSWIYGKRSQLKQP